MNQTRIAGLGFPCKSLDKRANISSLDTKVVSNKTVRSVQQLNPE
jgi:hypothetical protein